MRGVRRKDVWTDAFCDLMYHSVYPIDLYMGDPMAFHAFKEKMNRRRSPGRRQSTSAGRRLSANDKEHSVRYC